MTGLNVVGVGGFEGNIWTARPQLNDGNFIDERADERRRDALQTIWSGQAGGWPAGFAQLMEEVRGFEPAPIEVEIADDLAIGAWKYPGRQRAAP